MLLQGALTALITPFNNGVLDEDQLKKNIEFQIAEGIDGLVPAGTTGESPTLDFREHERVIEITVQTANARVPVIAGTGANATSEALELHAFAKMAGANGCLSVNPYYNKPSQEGLYRHFMTLADKVDLPIVLYNIPARTGITMLPRTVARLRKHPNSVAIKEATNSLDIASEIRSLCDITILSGDDSLTLPLMSIGAAGVISVASNLVPKLIKEMTKLALAGDFMSAGKIHHMLFPLIRSLFLDGNPAGIKFAMKTLHMDSGEVRLPLWEASEATQKTIQSCIAQLGLAK